MTESDETENNPHGALTLDQLIAELQATKASGLASGQELVFLGSDFMRKIVAVRSVALLPKKTGEMSIGISAESEREWALAAKSEAFFGPDHPAQDPLALAQRLGLKKQAAQVERLMLGQVADPVPSARPAPKSL
jgi:hypothetical protein